MAAQLEMIDGQVVIVPGFEDNQIQIIDPRETEDMEGPRSMYPEQIMA